MAALNDMIGSLRTAWTDGRRVERRAYAVGAALMAVGLAHLVVFAVDGGPWEGPVSWRKPVTFGLSFGLTLITLAWVAARITMGERRRTVALGLFTAASVIEVGFIAVQAWRGVPSHFNTVTAVDAAIAYTLAAGGAMILVSTVMLTIAAFRGNAVEDWAMRWAMRAGLVLLLASLAIGAVMIARGTVATRTSGLELATTTAGGLKPIHAVTLHAVLVLPGLAWLLGFTMWTPLLRLRVTQLGIAGYALVAVAIGAESAFGVSPFAAPLVADAAVVTGLVMVLLAMIVAGWGVAKFPAQPAPRQMNGLR